LNFKNNKMNKIKTILSIVLLFLIGNIYAQQTPAKKQSETISIVGATVHIGNGELIENAIVIFENGTITHIDKANNIKAQGEIIDAKNKHIYPGFIIPNSTLGLGEIDAVKATRDFDETGKFLPHVRSIIAYNAESKVSESVRPNGVLLAQITPRGGVISGTSSIVQLDAWNWEDAAYCTDCAIHLNWPSATSYNFRQHRVSKNEKYAEQVQEVEAYFQLAEAYSQKDEVATPNLRFE